MKTNILHEYAQKSFIENVLHKVVLKYIYFYIFKRHLSYT